MKVYAELQLRHCLRNSVDDWLLPVCQFGALLQGCEPYIRNGLVTPTPGGATVTRSTQPGASAAKSMSGIYGTALCLSARCCRWERPAAAPAASADRKQGATRFSISRGVGELRGD